MISWNELIDGLKGEVQDKSKNPFFGAFIATWLIRHWEVVFIILNFDDNFHLDAKLYRVQCYFTSRPDYDFLITIGFTFLVIFASYLFLNLARIISNFWEKIVSPWVYRWTAGKASIVTRETYDKTLLWGKSTKEKLEQQLKENTVLESKIEEWEQKFEKLNQQLDERNRIEAESEIENIQVDNNPDEISSSNSESFKPPKDLSPFSRAIYRQLSNAEKELLKEVVEKINNNDVIDSKNALVQLLVTKSIIEQEGDSINGFSHFNLTPLGNSIRRHFIS